MVALPLAGSVKSETPFSFMPYQPSRPKMGDTFRTLPLPSKSRNDAPPMGVLVMPSTFFTVSASGASCMVAVAGFSLELASVTVAVTSAATEKPAAACSSEMI